VNIEIDKERTSTDIPVSLSRLHCSKLAVGCSQLVEQDGVGKKGWRVGKFTVSG
jgi:hypothetical protein